jgi:hypothetical protein
VSTGHPDITAGTIGARVIDAAIALSDAGRLDNSTPSDGYGTPSSTTVGATIGLPLRKYGRTTGQTDGKVDAINAAVNVGYDTGTARFVGQVIIKGQKGSFSAGGDSGSLIVTKDGNNPVALLFAGNSQVTIANPIDAVLSRFNVTIDDGSVAPPLVTTGSVAGTVTDTDTSLPISGANVHIHHRKRTDWFGNCGRFCIRICHGFNIGDSN